MRCKRPDEDIDVFSAIEGNQTSQDIWVVNTQLSGHLNSKLAMRDDFVQEWFSDQKFTRQAGLARRLSQPPNCVQVNRAKRMPRNQAWK